jgi:hypothetical protein
MKRHLLSISAALIALLCFSGVAAQESTPTVEAPPNYTDGRINDNAELGGLAIYCVDINNNTHIGSFEEGAITVWGIGDQKYIELAAYQLRGRIEVRQAPSVAEAQLRLTATPQPTATTAKTEEPETTPVPSGKLEPFLVARANTLNGVIGFFRVGEDEFALQGHDDKENFFTYRWTACDIGELDSDAAPYNPMLEVTATPEPAEAMTEATSES